MAPLSGIRVLDLSHVLNGPFCTMLLASLGAEVIKVEPKEGDRYRHAWLPKGVKRDGYGFISVNMNKLGVTLNLKTDQGKRIFRRLVEQSDVLVENFSPGVIERLGFSPEALLEINDRLIVARSSGYGYSGPMMHQRSNAATNLAASGWQHAQETMADKHEFLALGIGDQASGVSMAVGICAALFERSRSGRGQVIEVSMQEALLGFMTQVFHTHFEGEPVAYPPKRCLDGYYAFHLPDIRDELWRALCDAMGEPDIADDPRFGTRSDRRLNAVDVEEIVSRWVASRTRAELRSTLSAIGLSGAPVLSLDEVLEEPHLRERKAFVEMEHPDQGTRTMLAPWIRFSRTPSPERRPSPLLGEHNEQVFKEVGGLSDDEFQAAVRDGVI